MRTRVFAWPGREDEVCVCVCVCVCVRARARVCVVIKRFAFYVLKVGSLHLLVDLGHRLRTNLGRL